MGKPHKDKASPVENKDLDLADALGLDVEELAENEDEIEEDADTGTETDIVEAPVTEEPKPVEAKKPKVASEIVKDDAGAPMFKRMAPTIDSAPVAKPRERAKYKPVDKQVAREASANPALLQFPTDRWGITKDLKKAMIHLASRIAGDDSKKALTDEVLKILVVHLNAKVQADKKYKAALAARNEQEDAE